MHLKKIGLSATLLILAACQGTAPTLSDDIRVRSQSVIEAPDDDFRYKVLQWHLRKTNVAQAWGYTKGRPDVIVAVLDTGVDGDHPALKGRVITPNAEKSIDEDAHGTHVAGIIAADGLDVRGVAPGVKILALKAFTDEEYGTEKAIQQAIKMGASVINMSFGDKRLMACNDESFNSALDEAYAAGISLVVSAGNDAHTTMARSCSPRANRNTIAVVATNQGDDIAPFSNFANLKHPKMVAAPGVSIFSSIPTTPNCTTEDCANPYASFDGTSMAAPVVAGGMALIRSAMYDDYRRVAEYKLSQKDLAGDVILSYREFFHTQQRFATYQMKMGVSPSVLSEQILFSNTNAPGSVDPKRMQYSANRDPVFGYGRVDIGRAVKAASQAFSAVHLPQPKAANEQSSR